MSKITLNSGMTLFPTPAAVISVGDWDEANLITLAWVGKVCSTPPTIAISIRPSRFSFKLIEKLGEFVINYPSSKYLREMDFCGTRSGKDINKWETLNLTKMKATRVSVPMIKEFPFNMECKVVKRVELGSHVCYFGEVLATHSDEELVKNNQLDVEKLETFVYLNGNYIGMDKGLLEFHGFSMK